MELQTISQVSKNFNVSTRTLRYYEQIGLIKSTKTEDYAYRTYDAESVNRLQQIIIFRKLRIPLKQIIHILEYDNIQDVFEIINNNLNEIDDEINALTKIKSVLVMLLERINEKTELKLSLNILDDRSLIRIVNSLSVTKINLKEESTMEDVNTADKKLSKLTDRNVRIIYLPPTTVAAIHCYGNKAEIETGRLLGKLMRNKKLALLKPDLRHYGFNHPEGDKPDGSDHGYERWVTIPEDMELQPPFIKKQFGGGLYAAHMIPMGAFDEWGLLSDWVMKSDIYQMNLSAKEIYYGLLEEHLNYINTYSQALEDTTEQVDLLLPIKEN